MKLDKNTVIRMFFLIMERIHASEDQDNYGYWKVIYEKTPGNYITVDEYSKDSLIENKHMDEDPEDWEIEEAIKDDFEERLEIAYKKEGMEGINRLLKSFKLN